MPAFRPAIASAKRTSARTPEPFGSPLDSDGTERPYRVRVRAPSYVNLSALPEMVEGSLLADTNQGGVTQLRTHLVLESPEPEEVVCRIIRAAYSTKCPA